MKTINKYLFIAFIIILYLLLHYTKNTPIIPEQHTLVVAAFTLSLVILIITTITNLYILFNSIRIALEIIIFDFTYRNLIFYGLYIILISVVFYITMVYITIDIPTNEITPILQATAIINPIIEVDITTNTIHLDQPLIESEDNEYLHKTIYNKITDWWNSLSQGQKTIIVITGLLIGVTIIGYFTYDPTIITDVTYNNSLLFIEHYTEHVLNNNVNTYEGVHNTMIYLYNNMPKSFWELGVPEFNAYIKSTLENVIFDTNNLYSQKTITIAKQLSTGIITLYEGLNQNIEFIPYDTNWYTYYLTTYTSYPS